MPKLRRRPPTPRGRVGSGKCAAILVPLLVFASACAPAPTSRPTPDIAGLLAKTSAFQRPLIEDGKVTPSEYEKALLAEWNCVRVAGASPGKIHDTGDNEQGFDYEILTPTKKEGDEIQKRADRCLPQYFSEVGAIWAFQQQRS
jgi:hypothetical protein